MSECFTSLSYGESFFLGAVIGCVAVAILGIFR